MAERWASVTAAIAAGKRSKLSRVVGGIPLMLRFSRILGRYRDRVPFGFLVVKGAFESKGVPYTQSPKDLSTGLFQIRPAQAEAQGFTLEEMKEPEKNTKTFVRLIESRVKSFESPKTGFPELFPKGRDWQFWGIMWITAAIGPHAMRHLLKQISSGGNAFDRVIKFVETHPAWMSAREQTHGFRGGSHWGNQSPELVAFRVMIAKTAIRMAQTVEKGEQVAPFVGAGAGTLLVIALIVGGVWYWKKRKKRRGLSGRDVHGFHREWTSYEPLSEALTGLFEK